MASKPVDSAGLPPLHWAALTDDKDSLKTLLKNQTADVNKKEKLGRTPLIFAVLGDNHESIEILLQHGARPDITDILGRNALHWAVFSRHANCIKLLLAWKGFGQSSQWHQVDEAGATILHTAAIKLTSAETSDLFHQILKQFKHETGNVNIQDDNGRTALHYAASVACPDNVSVLLKKGANPELVDHEKNSPLHIAVGSVTAGTIPPLNK